MTYRVHWWADIHRTAGSNLRLGCVLCVVAGATNAGGFLAVGQYTSHMSGILSSVADNVVLGEVQLVIASVALLMAFVLGSMTTAWMVNWSQRRQMRSAFARPLLVEAALLLLFGIFGASINSFASLFVPLTVLLLCFIMGLQNAVITKVSHAEIRTTHVTGLLTDLGIELGKFFYVNRSPSGQKVVANRTKMRIHALLVGSFLAGALMGAYGFKAYGYISTVPLAILLMIVTWGPLLDDVKNGRFVNGPSEEPSTTALGPVATKEGAPPP